MKHVIIQAVGLTALSLELQAIIRRAVGNVPATFILEGETFPICHYLNIIIERIFTGNQEIPVPGARV